MKIAIMQPYFFPYIGYWQLINSVDKFVIYDDVNYINRGWINRNRILINGEPKYITIPLHQSSQNKRICDIALHNSPLWREKLVKMIENTYRKAPNFFEVFPIIEELIRYRVDNLSDYLTHQLASLSELLGIRTEFVGTSRRYANSELSGQSRILDICKLEGATNYINLKGGQNLYNADIFQSVGIDLSFIVMRTFSYKQRTRGFIHSLSIIDALMELGLVGIVRHLNAFDFLSTGSQDEE